MTAPPVGSSRPLLPAVRASLGVVFLVGVMAIACTPTAPPGLGSGFSGVCLHPGCTSDPGWALRDCGATEAGLEFFPANIADFEYADSNGQNLARFMYGYTDGTSGTSANAGYQPAATTADRCTGAAGNHAFHLYGGPFRGWGGGIGLAIQHFVVDTDLCARTTGVCLPGSVGNTLSSTAIDVSPWEGVALWARRAPDSQPLLRVLVGNKDTDDDIAFLMYNDPTERTKPRYCERVKDCSCQFQDAPCTYFDAPEAGTASYTAGWYCKAPGATPAYANMAATTNSSNKCDTSRCDDPYPAYAAIPDDQFRNKPCTPYTTRNGVLSSYCFDPDTDPPPASGDQQCGDHFTFPLHLTTEWQLYLVPFTQMYQQGWAKKATYFDLQTVSVVRLTWDSGYIDYWIDDLRFYRHKK